MSTFKKVMTASIFGAVTGGLAGVLLAPQNGKETRKKMNHQAQKTKEELDDLVKKGRETVEDLKKEVKNAKRN